MHVIAAKAVSFAENLKPEFKNYAQQVVKNAQVLAAALTDQGIKLTSGGTDCHLILVDLTTQGINGADLEKALERAGITCNKNGIPNDPLPPTKTSGVRLGTPALTTRGMKEPEFKQIGSWIGQVIKAITTQDNEKIEQEIRQKVLSLCKQFPLYPELC